MRKHKKSIVRFVDSGKRTFSSSIESAIRNVGGFFGQELRYSYYSRKLKSCGKNVKIGEGVIIENPENIVVGDNVWIMPYTMITARPKNKNMENRMIKKKHNPRYNDSIGHLTIGNQVSIGAYNILQGYGGLRIEDKVTTSARVSVYSFSHYPVDERNPSVVTYANAMIQNDNISCIESPIVLEEGVWLGLGVTVFGGTVGKLSFVASQSIVIDDIERNSCAKGNPARRYRSRFEIDE